MGCLRLMLVLSCRRKLSCLFILFWRYCCWCCSISMIYLIVSLFYWSVCSNYCNYFNCCLNILLFGCDSASFIVVWSKLNLLFPNNPSFYFSPFTNSYSLIIIFLLIIVFDVVWLMTGLSLIRGWDYGDIGALPKH
jgi:hypothetical protein